MVVVIVKVIRVVAREVAVVKDVVAVAIEHAVVPVQREGGFVALGMCSTTSARMIWNGNCC